MYDVQFSAAPNDYTKNITEGTPVLTDGVYYQNWIQTDASESEINYRLENQWFTIREIRNQLLTECDWTQLSDIPTEIKNLWSSYRQDLRDITNQTNPFNIIWPVKP
jgi:t-SNARE complex subunit (syntaxin)